MNDIKASKKMGEGILISFEENGTNKFETYTFGELVDMKINAINLLERPMSTGSTRRHTRLSQGHNYPPRRKPFLPL